MNPQRCTNSFKGYCFGKIIPAKDSLKRGWWVQLFPAVISWNLQKFCTWGEEEVQNMNVYSFWSFTGGDGERLCSASLQLSPEASAGPRTLVLLPASQHDPLLLLQERCKHSYFYLCSSLTIIANIAVKSGCFFCPVSSCEFMLSSSAPTDVCGAHLLVSVLLWILRFSHDWPVVSYLLQPDVFRFPTTYHRHSGQRRVSRDSATTTSALRERTELRGPPHSCF